MAIDLHVGRSAHAVRLPRSWPLLLAVSVALSVVLATLGQLSLWGVVVAGVLTLVAAVYVALRSFAQFICAAIVVRPLVDLTAGPRSGGPGLTELFGVAVLGVSIAWLWVNRDLVRAWIGSGIGLALVAVVGLMALSAVGSPHPGESIPVVLRVSTGLVMFLVLATMLQAGLLTFRRLVVTMGAAAVVPLLYPALGLVGVPVTHIKDNVTALKSVFYLSNNFAHFLDPLIIVAASWVVVTRGRARLAGIAVLGVSTVELIGTETRGAWLAALVGVGAVGLLLSRRLLFGLAAAAVLAALFVPAVNARVTSLETDPADPRTQSSLAWRFDQWNELLPLTAASPVLGIGPGESVRLTDKEPHNDYVRALVESGILGLAAYLAMWTTIVVAAVRVLVRFGRTPLDFLARRRVRDPADRSLEPASRAVLVGISCYTIAVAAASFGENLLDNVTFLWSAFPLVAILAFAVTARADQLRLSDAGTTPTPAPAAAPDTAATDRAR